MSFLLLLGLFCSLGGVNGQCELPASFQQTDDYAEDLPVDQVIFEDDSGTFTGEENVKTK